MHAHALKLALISCALFAATFVGASPAASQTAAPDGTIYPLEAPPEPNAIPLNTGGVENQPGRESWFRQWGDPMARNITAATLTPFLPDPDKATGAAVIVAPGGGFMWLSMGNEGWEVAEALRARGVAAFVLKYRLQPTPDRLDDFKRMMDERLASAGSRPPRLPTQLTNPVEDATAAFTMVRARAGEWGVDPNRIGMMGFSAGAGTTMATLLQAPENKPAFIAPIYGAMSAIEVPADAPPMFVALAADDPLFARSGFGLIESWRAAGRPVEFHLYQNGGHGFGLGNPNRTSNIWFESFMHWLDVNGFLKGGE